MVLKRGLAATTAVIAALAVPAAATSVARADDPGGSPRCPDGYAGPINLATGCPWYVMVSDSGAPYPWPEVLCASQPGCSLPASATTVPVE